MPKIIIEEIPNEYKEGGWIQSATASIKRRGTKGVCTGSKFGGPSCRPGTRRYALAKTFKKMARNREDGGMLDEYMCGGKVKYDDGGSIDLRKIPEFQTNWDEMLESDVTNPNKIESIASSSEKFTPYHGSYIPGAVNIAGNIYGAISANRANKKNKFEFSPDYNPETIDLTDAREIIKERGNTRFNTLKSSIKSLTPQQQAAVLASYSNADENQAIRESYLNENSMNADIKNKSRMYNIEKRSRERQMKREQDEAARQEKQAYINNIFNTVSAIGSQGQKYDVLNMLSDNYMIEQDPNANLFQKFAGTRPKYRVKT